MSSLQIATNYPFSDVYPCHCENCGESMPSSELVPISDAQERLTPGEETPAGQCPHCRALAWVTKTNEE